MEVSSLVTIDQKTYLSLIHEVYDDEFKAYTKKFNELKGEEKYHIGAAFCEFLKVLPKRKALYSSFLERQEDQNPKDYKNVMRFLNEMKIKTEFQAK